MRRVWCESRLDKVDALHDSRTLCDVSGCRRLERNQTSSFWFVDTFPEEPELVGHRHPRAKNSPAALPSVTARLLEECWKKSAINSSELR